MATAKGGLRAPASEAILMLALELLAVGLFTLLAGASSEAGTIMILIMTGLWLIFAITNAKVISGIGSMITALTTNPMNVNG